MQKTLLAVAALAVCASVTEAAPERKFHTKPALHKLSHKFPHHNSTEPFKPKPFPHKGIDWKKYKPLVPHPRPTPTSPLEEETAEARSLPYNPPTRRKLVVFKAEEELEEALDFSNEQVVRLPQITTRIAYDIVKWLKGKAHGGASTFDEDQTTLEAELLAMLEEVAPEDRITVLGEVLEELGDEMEDGQQSLPAITKGVITVIQIIASIVTGGRH